VKYSFCIPFISDFWNHLIGIKKYDISEIGHERRNGYSWYNKDGSKVLKRYEDDKGNDFFKQLKPWNCKK